LRLGHAVGARRQEPFIGDINIEDRNFAALSGDIAERVRVIEFSGEFARTFEPNFLPAPDPGPLLSIDRKCRNPSRRIFRLPS
jgi:hypothetical protein